MSENTGLETTAWPGWRSVRLIGEGSFAKVYEIEKDDGFLKRSAALKVIRIPNDRIHAPVTMPEASRRSYLEHSVRKILEEIRLMTQLQSQPNIISYEDYQVTEEDGGWTILIRMPLLQPFSDWMKAHQPDEADILRLGIQIGSALERCHSLKIIHRDVKPENIFVNAGGDFLLGDFGISRTLEEENGSLTYAGTLNYMAPEIFRRKQYGYSADIYSLALILYELLNDGNPPYVFQSYYDADEQEKARIRRMRGDTIYPPKHGSGPLQLVILRALQYEPESRYPSTEEFVEALQKCEASESDAPHPVPAGNETVYAGAFQTAGMDASDYVDTDSNFPHDAPIHPKQGYPKPKVSSSSNNSADFSDGSVGINNTGNGRGEEKWSAEGAQNPKASIPPSSAGADKPADSFSRNKLIFIAAAAVILGLGILYFIAGPKKPDANTASTASRVDTEASQKAEQESTSADSASDGQESDNSGVYAFLKREYADEAASYGRTDLIPANLSADGMSAITVDTQYLEEDGFRVLDEYLSDFMYAVAFRPEDQELANTVSGAILGLVQDGTYASIVRQYPEIQGEFYLNDNYCTDDVTIPERGSGNPDFVFRQGLDEDFYPFTELTEKGEPRGIDVELAQAVCEYMGWQYEAVPINWDNQDMTLKVDKECDCIWSGLIWSDSREPNYSWSIAYTREINCCIVPEDSPIQALDDLTDKYIAYDPDAFDAEYFVSSYTYLFEENGGGLSVLKSGSYDAYVTSVDLFDPGQ